MDHIFVYARPTDNTKDARISEISAVRFAGYGPYKKSDAREAFTGKAEDDSKGLLAEMRERILPGNPFVVVSYCNEITRSLLRIEYEKCGVDDMFAGRAWIDIQQLAWPLVAGGLIKTRQIAELAKHFGVSIDDSSKTTEMCSVIVQVYGAMMRRYRTALQGESWMREAGGETLENFRKIIGF